MKRQQTLDAGEIEVRDEVLEKLQELASKK